ncbi:hypothetical protein ScPMuIL_008677 [Solemya velum]
MDLVVVGVVVAIIVVLLLAFLAYSGLFTSVNIGTGRPPIGEVIVAYKFSTGPYERSEKLFREFMKIDDKRTTLGIYYDNPDEVSAERLRYVVGQIVAENEDPVDRAVRRTYEESGCRFITLPPTRAAINAWFPHRNKLSIFFGMRSFYSKLMRYVEEKKLPLEVCLEIYDGETIQYMVPLDEQDAFFVPEAKKFSN